VDLSMSVDKHDVAVAFRVMNRLDPESVKQLKKDLKSALAPTAKRVASEYPHEPILSGFEMAYNKWRWDKVVGKVSITPGISRKGPGFNNLVSLQMQYKAATPYVIDMVGQVTQGRTPQGKALYRALQDRLPGWPKGGRVFYKSFKQSAYEIRDQAVDIINAWSARVNKELQ
jgi:hypothetical protein